VRSGARALGLSTEASTRFERGIDPDGVMPSLDFVAGLIAEVSGGWVSRGRMDRGRGGEEPVRLPFDPSAPARLTGADIAPSEVRIHLEKLGFEWKSDGNRAMVQVPTWRGDVRREADLVEEVARSYGYDRIPERQWNGSGVGARRSGAEKIQALLGDTLVGFGWDEAATPSLVSPEESALSEWLAENEGPWEVSNAPSREVSNLRRGLLPSLLRAAAHNLNRSTSDVRLFELGKIFTRQPSPLGTEHLLLGAVATGRRRAEHWGEEAAEFDLYDIKGVVEAVLGILRIDSCEIRCYDGPGFDRQASLQYLHRGSRIALAGRVDPAWAGRFGIEAPVFALAADCMRLGQALGGRPVFREPSRFPSVRRDLAFIVPESVAHGDVASAIRASGGELVTQVRLFDLYSGEKLGAGRKSLAYAVTFQSKGRTLTDREADAAVEAIVRHVTGTLGAIHRAS
jgi:phenylalanyl-tRNA synthetase beta chain